MRRNIAKMHTFYTADAQEHCKNAYILYRGCAGTLKNTEKWPRSRQSPERAKIDGLRPVFP